MQLFIDMDNSGPVFVCDPALTIVQLKNVIEEITFIPSSIQNLYFHSRLLQMGTLEDNFIIDSSTIQMKFSICGGGGDSTRYKKSTSAMRWKWVKKRTRRLQRKRRQMRQRAR
jgi:hypothetical protein